MNEKKNRFALLAAALGLWLIAFPLTFGFKCHPVEISDITSGFLLVALALLSLAQTRIWPGWGVGVIGVWLQMAPLLFWAPKAAMYVNDTLVGALAIILSFLLTHRADPAGAAYRPLGWSYNPSSWSHRIPTVALALLCWFFSRYMAAFQLGYIDYIWDPFFPEGTLHVITSTISKDFPVSDAGLGALCYTLEFLFGWQGSPNRFATMPWLVFAFAFLVIPVGMVSITLIILQPVIVGAWCSWCLATAASMLLMIILTAGELAGVLQFLMQAKKKGSSLWNTFWKGGKPDQDTAPVKPRGKRFAGVSLGNTFPWNLLLSIALGIWLMASPSILGIQGNLAVSDYIGGPLVVAFSVIALAESFRAVRLMNILFGLGLIAAPWFFSEGDALGMSNNILAGLFAIGLSWRKGKIVERYGNWEKLII